MSNNFVSFNLKAKKKCDADGMILHCVDKKARLKSDNITIPKYTKYNVNSDDIHGKYLEVTRRIEEIKGKKIQKNANHYLEGVLAFSFDKFAEDNKEFRKKAPKLIEEYGKKIAAEYGFEYLGFSLHYDECKTDPDTGKPIIDKKTGLPELNVHAHISFVNYDFNQNKARFREYQQKYVSKRKYPNMHFVKMQDMANEVFEKSLGFVRGVSKSITKKTHKEKNELINEKNDIINQELNAEIAEIAEKSKELNNIENNIKSSKEKLSDIENQISLSELQITALFNKFMLGISKYVKSLLNRKTEDIDRDIEYLSNVVDETHQISPKSAEKMINETNNISESFGVNKKIKYK